MKEENDEVDKKKIIIGAGIIVAIAVIIAVIILVITPKKGQAAVNQKNITSLESVNNDTQSLSEKQTDVHEQQAVTKSLTKSAIEGNTKPPVISGVSDKTYNIGDKVSYMSGVSAKDENGTEIEVSVDNSEVNANKEGAYNVYYTAEDKDGNIAKETAVYTFVNPQPVTADSNSLDGIVSEVLSEITNDSMSMGQKLRAVFNYAHSKIGYQGTPLDGSDRENEAYQALKAIQKSGYVGGDCFTYCCVDKALLEGLGVSCIWVDNQGAATGDHSWLLCNAGTGWYHFDSTRMYDKFECFMLTDEEIQDYLDTGKSIYKRDLSAYPKSASEIYTY